MPPIRLAVTAAAVAAGAFASVPRPSLASLIIALDTPTMVEKADHIAVVDVTAMNAAWDESHQHILTTVDLTVVETWKGSVAPATHVKVVQPGGTVGDLQQVVFGMSHFAIGERALVFLQGTTDHARVVGMSQGKRVVRRELATGRWVVHAPDRAGASFVQTTPARSTPATPLPIMQLQARPLDDLRAEVRALLVKAKTR